MNPQNDQSNGQVGTPMTDQSDTSRSSLAPPARTQAASQQAAANIIRDQLESIYSGNGSENTPQTTPVAVQPPAPATTPQTNPTPQPDNKQAASAQQQPAKHGLRTAPPIQTTPVEPEPTSRSVYQQTMSARAAQPTDEQWRQYHSAWQKYYQMYYERHYLSSLYQKQLIATPADEPDTTPAVDGSISQNEAMKELRASIRQKVASSAEKVTKSRHFIPIIAGLAVLLLFVILQYNRIIVGAVYAYTSPGNTDPQSIIANPSAEVEVSSEPRMIIPKINVDAPVVYGIGPDYNSQMNAMRNGIAHFSIPGANAVPGQVGNAVFAAHSSNDAFAAGDYKFVFARNEKLVEGDIIYMNYESKRYTYSVTSTEVVLPTEVSKIQITTDKPMLTLISCVPLGTAQKRLLVFAEQVSPDPKGATAAADSSTAATSENIPGNPSPTLLERIFGAS